MGCKGSGVSALTASEITALRDEMLLRFEEWESQLRSGLVTHLQITVRAFGPANERVMVSGTSDPKHRRKLAPLALMR